jgi:WD40 repeat protein
MWIKQFIVCLLCCAFQFSAMSQKSEIALRNKNNKKIIYNGDQKLMAIADGDEIHVMLTGGNVINNSFKTALNEINDVCFSHDGDKIFAVGKNSTSKNAILLYEAKSGTLIKSILVGVNEIVALAASRDGNQLAVCASNKMAMVFSLQTDKLLYQFKNHHGEFTDLAFNKKGTQLYCSSSSGHFFDVSTIDGSFTKVMSFDDEYMRCIEVSNDGKYVACGFDNGICKLLQPENKYAKYHLAGNQKKMYSLSFSEDDRYIASCSADKIVNIWSLEQMALKREIKVENANGTLTCVRFDPGGKWIYGTDDNSKKLVQVDVSELLR